MKAVFVLLVLLISTFCFGQDEGGLQLVNGTKLFVRSIGKGEPIIVVHGGPGLNHEYFLPHLESLSKRFTLFFYDQRASGRSQIPANDSISLKFFTEDIESIRKSLAAEKITILAHSWGAIPAVNYAYNYRHRVKRLILCNPVPLSKEYDAELQATQRSKFTSQDSTDRSIIVGSPAFKLGRASAYKNLLMYSFRHSFFDEQNISKLRLEVPENYVKASQALYTGLGKELANYNYYDYLKSFEFKVLIIHGSADAVPLAALTRMHDQIPQATLLIFHKSGHFAFIEQRKKFDSEVTDFIKE